MPLTPTVNRILADATRIPFVADGIYVYNVAILCDKHTK